jgi:sulfide:quinone oxidoreductase
MIKKLTDEISVAPQIKASELAELAAQGFRSIVCNRPDGEGADQPAFSEIERAASAVGVQARFIPVEAGKVSDAAAVAFAAACEELPKPILAYCRSGTRSTKLWELAQDRLQASAVEDAR